MESGDPDRRSGTTAHEGGLPEETVIADLGDVATDGTGAAWSLPNRGDLNANLVHVEPNEAIGEHVNDEVDVMLIVRTGSGRIRLDNEVVDLVAERLVFIPRGVARSIEAGPAGVTYLSIHRRRQPLTVRQP